MSKLRRPDGTVKVPWSARFEYQNRDGVTKLGKGRTFEIEGQHIDLFPVGVLVGALGRSHQCIYTWEKKFGFPPALFQVTDMECKKMRLHCTRWYSRKQILVVLRLYETFGKLRGEHRKKLHTFIAAVRKVFHTIDKPVELR